MDANLVMENLSRYLPDERFVEAEDIWAGGIADLGDNEAGWMIQCLPGYFDYKSAVEEIIRKVAGDQFVVYRLMTAEQFEQIECGAGLGVVAVSLSKSTAEAFRNTPHYSKRRTVLVSALVEPSQVVMRGKTEECELVVDGDWWDNSTVEVLEKY